MLAAWLVTLLSYIVLCLLAAAGEATPDDLKNMVAGSVGLIRPFDADDQLDNQAARWQKLGWLHEERETGRAGGICVAILS